MDKCKYLELFSVYKGLLTENQADVFSLYVECDLSLKEIAEIKLISRQGVSDTINKTKEILQNYESKLKLLYKREKLNKIKDLLDGELKDELIKILEE